MAADGATARLTRSRTQPRARVLFVAENVSLAQVVRLRVLCETLDPARFEVWFACSGYDPLVFRGVRVRRRPIHSISAARMMRRIARGARLYDTRTLVGYVREDIALLEEVQPALIVGDLRLSLSIAAPKLGVPYAALINAYWSPHRQAPSFPVPEHPLVRLLGHRTVARHMHKAMPWVLGHFARPVNVLRREYGLPPIGDLQQVLAFGDHLLHPDVPELVALDGAPSHHHFLGPVLWSPDLPLPAAILRRDGRRPLVYVTLGSTGDLRVMRAVLAALSSLPVDVLLATAGRVRLHQLPANVVSADFVPGHEAARRASLVICNGGSSTGYQALHEGVPVLGLPFNFDQSLAMAAIEAAGAGRSVRTCEAKPERLRAEIEFLLRDGGVRDAAKRLAHAMRRADAAKRFGSLVERVTASTCAT